MPSSAFACSSDVFSDRKSTRLNSSHIQKISYAVFCLKKKSSREGSRNRRRLKANQTGKKFRVGIKSIIIFFFKQKTAYEISECDWSSTCALPISTNAGDMSPDNIRRAMLLRDRCCPCVG